MPGKRIALYGGTFEGKTSFVTTYPTPGKIIYIPYDLGGHTLESVRPEDKERLHVRIPTGSPTYTQEAVALLSTPWSTDELPDSSALILDTATSLDDALLSESVESGWLTSSNVGAKVTDKEARLPIPQPLNYGWAQSAFIRLLTFFNQKNPDLDLICCFQPGISEPKSGSPTGIKGGPSIAGNKGPILVPPYFTNALIRLTRDPQDRVIIHTKPEGIWNARVRGWHSVPPKITIGPDRQSSVDAWNLILGEKRND